VTWSWWHAAAQEKRQRHFVARSHDMRKWAPGRLGQLSNQRKRRYGACRCPQGMPTHQVSASDSTRARRDGTRRHPLVARLGIFFSEARGNPTEQGVRPHGAPIGHHSMHGSLTHAPWRLALAFVAPSMVHGRHGGPVLHVRQGAENPYFRQPLTNSSKGTFLIKNTSKGIFLIKRHFLIFG